MSSLLDTPPEATIWQDTAFCSACQPVIGGAGEHPIGGNIGKDEGLDAKGLHLLGEVQIVQPAAFHPAGGLDHAVQGVDAHSDPRSP